MARASLSPPYSEQSPAKRVCEEKGRRNAHSAVFAARRKRNGASFFTPPRTPSKAQRSGFARKKEEGESIMEFSPQGGNGMARTSLLPRPPSKAQQSGFARKKEEGESIMKFSPQGGNGMARTSSDAVRRVCSCQSRVSFNRLYPTGGSRVKQILREISAKNCAGALTAKARR